jgi:mycothiol synthase
MPWHFHPRKYAVDVQVAPDDRGRGHGTTLLVRLLDDLRIRDALSARAVAVESDLASISFLTHRGFQEVWRNLWSRLDVTTFDPRQFAHAWPRVEAQGVTLTTLADEMDREPGVIRDVYELYTADDPAQIELDPVTPPSFERFLAEEIHGPGAMLDAWFLALDGARVVGMSTLERLGDGGDMVETGVTVVHPEHRRRGIAMALKLATIAYAREHGHRSIQTDSNATNEPMLAINRVLGFHSEPARITFRLDLA